MHLTSPKTINVTRFACRLLSGLLLSLSATAVTDAAETLYMLDVNGALLEVNQETGATTTVLEDFAFGSWTGLTASPNNPRELFAAYNPTPPSFDDPKFSGISRIDLQTGEANLLPFFDTDELGIAEVFTTGIAISPSEPNEAYAVGSDLNIPPQPYIWKVDLATGRVSETAKPLSNLRRIESITFNRDGSRLYGANQDGELVTIDLDSQSATVVGDPDLSASLTGLAFRDDDRLFAINGRRDDELVELAPTDTSVVSILGDLGIAGPEGLAFLPGPDPLDCNEDFSTDTLDLECANAAGITTSLLDELGLVLGDLNGEDGVTLTDFLILARNFAEETNRYTDGDLDNSGRIDLRDFLILASNFGEDAPAASITAAVPEPLSNLPFLPLLVVCALALRERRQRNSSSN